MRTKILFFGDCSFEVRWQVTAMKTKEIHWYLPDGHGQDRVAHRECETMASRSSH